MLSESVIRLGCVNAAVRFAEGTGLNVGTSGCQELHQRFGGRWWNNDNSNNDDNSYENGCE